MSKKLLYLLTAVACLGFTACNEDDKNDSASKTELNKLTDNQISLNGEVYDLNVSLGVRPADGEDAGAHYLDITPKNVQGDDAFVGRFDIGTPLMGISINLADPLKAVGKNQFSVQFTDAEWERTYYAMDCVENYVYSRIEGDEYENSGFKEGLVISKHNSNGFTFQMYGTLLNGKTIAIKVSIPEANVDYWEANFI